MRHHYALSSIALLVLLGFKASLVIAQTLIPPLPLPAPMPSSPSAAPASSASDPTPYVDRLLDNGKSNNIAADNDEQDTPNTTGLPRSIRIELQRSHTLSNGDATSSGNGLAIRAALDTPNFGSLTLDTQLGTNQSVSTSSPGAIRPFTLTLQQIGLPLGAGWFANNILGILGPTQIGLARQQLRFSIPSRTIEGVATELLSPDVTELRAQVSAARVMLARALRRVLDTAGQRLDRAARRLISPAERLHRERDRLALIAARNRNAIVIRLEACRFQCAMLRQRLAANAIDIAHFRTSLEQRQRRIAQASAQVVASKRSQFDAARQALMLLDPARVLERGYSIVEHRGVVLRDARQVANGDHLRVRLARGTLEASVTSAATVAPSESDT